MLVSSRHSGFQNSSSWKQPTAGLLKKRPIETARKMPITKLEPVKLESVSLKKANVGKGPTRTSVVPDTTKSAGSCVKPLQKPSVTPSKTASDIKKQEVKKPAPPPIPVEVTHEGNYELNQRMTKMVEAELQDIMIKVWQELPDNPSDDAEALVADKLRNKAGDYLRNVLGLNITKRLLNVYNPLLVKVQFTGKPEKIHLGQFLKKYNFITFKRIENTVNMFAARVKTINDFDNICSTKDVRCGDVKVTINPMYRFTKCPQNLITSFIDEDETSTTTETNEKEVAKIDTKVHKEKNPPNVASTTGNDSSKTKINAMTTENVKAEKVQSKLNVVSKPDNKTATIINKDKLAIENKKIVTKPIENKTVGTKPVIENKVAVNKAKVENKVAVNKATVENKEDKKPTAGNKPTVSNPAVKTKTDVNKTTVENKTAVKAFIDNKQTKSLIATNAKNAATKKPVASPVKTQTKASVNTNLKKKEPFRKTNKIERDNDELDDHDILALMSEGIVLDECSGSDVE